MVITNQGVAIQLGFSSKTTCIFENRPTDCVYKTGTKYASKDGIELAIHKAFREVLIEVLSFGFGFVVLVLAHLLTVLLRRWIFPRAHRGLQRTQTSTQ
jgi:hypothetical protein